VVTALLLTSIGYISYGSFRWKIRDPLSSTFIKNGQLLSNKGNWRTSQQIQKSKAFKEVQNKEIMKQQKRELKNREEQENITLSV
jgi:hypothetical protein